MEVLREKAVTKEEAWDNYTIKFNLLSEKLIRAGIDQKMLIELLESYLAYEKFTTPFTT